MANVTIYHNPRCTKSRQTLALLQDHGIEPKIVEYLKDPPGKTALKEIIKKLGIQPGDLIRKKDYAKLGLPDSDDSQQLIQTMVDNPEIIERPVVVHGDQARIGRPPENVL
ncbi:MAG: arsenate reductase (glutaredoxin), partial [Planctomycetales bacterium]